MDGTGTRRMRSSVQDSRAGRKTMPVTSLSSFNTGRSFGTGTNLAANIALGGVRAGSKAFAQVSERLSTGLRINKASDAPSGFRTVEALRYQLAGITAAITNTQFATSTLSVAQGGLADIFDTLSNLRATALKALASDVASADRSDLQDQADDLLHRIDRTVAGTSIGGNRILDGSGDFFTRKTPGAFDEINIKRMTFAPGATSREFTLDVTRAAERAAILTNLDLSGPAPLAQNGTGSFSLTGPRGSFQLRATSITSAKDLVTQINAAASSTGVFASSHISNGAELRFDSASANGTLSVANDLEFTAGNSITFDVSVGGVTKNVRLTATGDSDNDTFREITAADLQAALNSANLGNFSVLGGTSGGLASLAIRHAGGSDFTINNVTNVAGSALNAGSALLGASFTGTEPNGARLISDGTNLAGPNRFAVQVFDSNGARTRIIDMLNSTPADFIAALAGIATVTDLGVGSNGRQILRFDAAPGVDAFRFMEAAAGRTDAKDLGLLSDSGGSSGLASRGMGVLGLYSSDFGSDQQISLSNTGAVQANFAVLDEASPATAGIAPGSGAIKGFGVDAVAYHGNQRITGRGFHLEYASGSSNFSVDLSARLGSGSFTAAINRALHLNYANPSAETRAATRPITQMYTGDSFALTNLNDPLGADLAAVQNNLGAIDRVSFTVFNRVPDSRARSGLGIQLSGEQGGHEYIGVQSFDTSVLGGIPTAEGLSSSQSSKLLLGQGAISQIRRGGAFSLEGSPDQIRNAIAVLDRAMSQTIRAQTQLGTYQTATLDRNRNFLESQSAAISTGRNDIASTDVAADVVALSAAQLRVQAATSVLAQANSLPQTLLQLLR